MSIIKAYAAFEQGADLQPFEYDLGALHTNDVEIDVEYCGICHSDLSMLDNEWGRSRYPLVAGHEIIGRVSAVGSSVITTQVGDYVGLGWHSDFCFKCTSCDDGDHNLCGSAKETIVGRHGGFADKVRAHHQSVVVLPEAVNPASAGPLFCGGITVFNPLVQFDVKAGDHVAVIGIGGLGHMAIQFLKAWGCEVTAFTSNDSKREQAMLLGADHVVSSTDNSVLKKLYRQFELILSTVNVSLNWNYYLETLKPKGRLHFVGMALEPLNIAAFRLISSQRSISGSPVGSPSTIKTMLDFVAKHDIEPQVEYFPFDEINDALKHVREGKARYRVVLKK